MTWSPESIPIWLQRTPEQQAQDDAYQDTLRQARGPGRRPSRTEQRLLRAAAVKLSATAELEHLTKTPDADPAQILNATAQLAEALALEGEYERAAELHPDPEHGERFARIAAAVDRDDDEHCDCPIRRETDPTSGKSITMLPDRVEELVISKKHGRRLRPLVTCMCGDMNVKAAPPHLEERMRQVQQTHQEAHQRAKEQQRR